MRSRSSTISSVSSCSTTTKVQPDANNPMAVIEKEVVSDFVLELYHKGLIQHDGFVEKSKTRTEFNAFSKAQKHKDYFADKNIGTLLKKNRLLFNTERGSPLYRISMKNLYEHRNAKLKKMDDIQIKGEFSVFPDTNDSGLKGGVIEEMFEIDPDAEEFPVFFRGGFEQIVDPDFSATVSGCYICQKNFTLQSDFEEHVEFHGFVSDFEFLSSPGKSCNNIFDVIYRLVNKSHNFYFTMKTNARDIILEKIILIKTNMMHYIKSNALPYEIPSDGIDSFLIDSHFFAIGVEQPIVLVYRNKSDKTKRFVEQHHFMRTDNFPLVHFNTRSYRISPNQIMKAKFKLGEYEKELQGMKKLIKEQQFSTDALSSLSLTFRDFTKNKKLDEWNSYEVLRTLNQIEDVCAQEDYAQLRQQGAKIRRFHAEYSLKIVKLPKDVVLENVLSPLDEIYLVEQLPEDNYQNIQQFQVNKPRRTKKKIYRAVIERVYYNTVCFKYEGPPICDKKAYDVSFKPSRLGLRYQYRALDMLKNSETIKRYLFPLSTNLNNVVSSRDFELFNPSIKINPEQLEAVRNIVGGPSSFAPYIIFGPPGTGKTSTIVEAVLQLWKQRPDTHILITAGSNAACDEVAVRLCRVLTELNPGQPNILRIFARSNEKRLDSIDELLVECSNFYRFHFYPHVDAIRRFRIVVCTLSVVGKLVTGGIGNHFFTHVFIDECAASTEPEALIGIAGTFSMNTRLILAGDHKQLGPVLKSSVANDLGLKVSLMERLLDLDCYSVSSNGDYDRSIQSRLVQNFRSHSKIVDLFNTLYYGGTLKSMVNDDDVNLGSNWHRMPNKGFPVVFHAAYGSNCQGGRSLSLSNEKEVEIVMDYVKDLMFFGINGQKITESDIGVISPYKKQYMRIQEELNRRRWFQIEVGAVETFQGKEKRIIIVSNVRSFTKTLGFLDNPRRINVILSRAQCLLIMIGNPNTLSQNEDFKYIISECRKNNSTVGSFRDIEMQEKRETEEKDNNFIKSTENGLNNTAIKEINTERRSYVHKNRQRYKKNKKSKSMDEIIKSSPANKIANHLHTKDNNANDQSISLCKLQNKISHLNINDKQNNKTTTHQNPTKELTQEDISRQIYAYHDDVAIFKREIEKMILRESQPAKVQPVHKGPLDKDLEIRERINKLCQPTRIEPPQVTNFSVHNLSTSNRQFASSTSNSNYYRTPLTFINDTNKNERDNNYKKIFPDSKNKSSKKSDCVLL